MNNLEANLRKLSHELSRELVMEKAYNEVRQEIGDDEAKIGELTKLSVDAYKVVKDFFVSRGVEANRGLVVLDSVIIAHMEKVLENLETPATTGTN